MLSETAAKIRRDPAFAELVAKRNRFSATLCIAVLVIYYGFILLVAFAKDFLAIKVGEVVTLAFPLGLAVILGAILITGLYVVRANGEYDRLTRGIVQRLR